MLPRSQASQDCPMPPRRNIATSFVESTVNQVGSKRMVKKSGDGLDGAETASAAAGANSGVERGIGRDVPSLVSRVLNTRTSRAGGGCPTRISVVSKLAGQN